MEDTDPGLANIWHMDSEPLMAALSLGVLMLMALGALALAVRGLQPQDDVLSA
jgi:hypothetical protein